MEVITREECTRQFHDSDCTGKVGAIELKVWGSENVFRPLVRYENGVARSSMKHQRNFHSKVIVLSILTMALIFSALVYVFISSRFVEPVKVIKTTIPKPKAPQTNSSGGIEIMEISGRHVKDSPPKRIKRLDSDESDRFPDSQKLVFFPSSDLKPPKIMEKPRVINFPQLPANHRMSSRIAQPRPFNHMMKGTKPGAFQKMPYPRSTARSFHQPINNIHDVIQQNQLPGQRQPQNYQVYSPRNTAAAESSMQPVHLAGKYRHPRKNGELTQIFTSDQKNQQQEVPDVFHNFRPNSPFEINQMMMNNERLTTPPTTNQNPYFRRKFRHQVASIPHYNIKSKDVANIYRNVLQSGKKFQERNEVAKQKPLSLMLDVYPFQGEGEMEMNPINQWQPIQSQTPANVQQNYNQMQPQMPHNVQQMQHNINQMQPSYTNQVQHNTPQQSLPFQQQTMPSQQYSRYPRMPQMKPFQGFYQDPTYFNTMPYPQLMPRYPAQHRYQQDASNINQIGMLKPSQLVVHLNLYPKNKVSYKRSSTEEEAEQTKKVEKIAAPKVEAKNNSKETFTSPLPVNINFNVNTGNGHPENIHHQVSIPRDPYHYYNVTTEAPFKPNYYYDENDDDQNLMVAPSLIYNHIVRDRPIHLMLQNATTTEKPANHKQTYQSIVRPRKQKIKNEPRSDGAGI